MNCPSLITFGDFSPFAGQVLQCQRELGHSLDPSMSIDVLEPDVHDWQEDGRRMRWTDAGADPQ